MNESINKNIATDEIDFVEIAIFLLKYKKLFIISFLLTLIIFAGIYFLVLNNKIEYKKSITFYTGIPKSILNLKSTTSPNLVLSYALKSHSSSENGVYTLTLISRNSNDILLAEKQYFEVLNNRYIPFLKERLKPRLKLLKNNSITFDSLPDYNISIFEQTQIIKNKKYKTKKIALYFLFLLIGIFFIDIFIIYSFNFLKKLKTRLNR